MSFLWALFSLVHDLFHSLFPSTEGWDYAWEIQVKSQEIQAKSQEIQAKYQEIEAKSQEIQAKSQENLAMLILELIQSEKRHREIAQVSNITTPIKTN